LALKATASFEQVLNKFLSRLFGVLLKLLGGLLRWIALFVSIIENVVTDFFTEENDAAAGADATQNFEDVAIRHFVSLILL